MAICVKPEFRLNLIVRRVAVMALGIALTVTTAAFSNAGTLVDDTNAGILTQGSESYFGTFGFPTFDLYGDVEYAVYAPGSFNTSFPGLDPSGDSQYVYAYQAFNTKSQNDGAAAGPGMGSINIFTVGVDETDAVFNIGAIDDPNGGTGVAPVSSSFTSGPGLGNTSARWFYSAPGTLDPSGAANPPTKSQILLFTSPLAPQTDFATLRTAGNTADTQILPSPEIPEPSSLILLALGAVLLLGRFRTTGN